MRQVRLRKKQEPQAFKEDCSHTYGQHIAKRSSQLGAGNPRDEGSQFVFAFDSAVLTDNARKGRSGCRRLLGCENETQNLQEDETDGVIGSGEESIDEKREVGVVNAQLDSCGNDGKKTASDGSRPHVPVFTTVVRNVMFAAVSGAFHSLSGDEVQVLAQEG